MKYLYIFITIIVIASLVIVNTGKASDAPISYGPSNLEANHVSTKLSKTKKISTPSQIKNSDLSISASSYIVLDRTTLTPLLEKNINKDKLIASVTKLMVAVVTLENAKLDDVVEVKRSFEDVPSGKMGLNYGENITVENLLKGLLISSSNDAAEVLAYKIGNGNYQNFLKLMNNKAVEIGMTNTKFSNSMGLDYKDNYSTAYDLALLGNYALKNQFISDTVKISQTKVSSKNSKLEHNLKSTNQLLDDKEVNVYGLKTGSTPLAGECLLSVAKTKSGHEIITVVLGSADRFGDTKKILQWVENNIQWK